MMGQSPVLLVIDDEPGVLAVVRHHAQRAGFSVVTCTTGANAVALVREHRADAAIVDLCMPEVGGLDVLRSLRNASPGCQTILMTGYATVDTAVEAIKLGALDYLSKPFDLARLESLLASVRDTIDRRRALVTAEAGLARQLEFCGMIGRSAAMQGLFDQVRRFALHLRSALVSGETGTGKELVARALHAMGPRRDRPFVVVDCAASGDPAFEATLFGVAPSPHGASAQPGVLAAADGGVLFLDEVANLPTAIQARLSRVIETGELHGAGGPGDQRIDVVVIAATHRDLRAEVAAGRFRSDLLYRLNSVELVIPPLREHRDDIPYLTAAFLREMADRLGKPIHGLTPNAEVMLSAATWGGNVRELRNVIERTCMLADGSMLTEQDVQRSLPPVVDARPGAPIALDDGRTLSTVEREHIMKALQRVGGNKKAAARMLGVSRRALYRRLERLELGATISRRQRSGALNGSVLTRDEGAHGEPHVDHLVTGLQAAAHKRA